MSEVVVLTEYFQHIDCECAGDVTHVALLPGELSVSDFMSKLRELVAEEKQYQEWYRLKELQLMRCETLSKRTGNAGLMLKAMLDLKEFREKNHRAAIGMEHQIELAGGKLLQDVKPENCFAFERTEGVEKK